VRIAEFTYATQPRGGVLHALALSEALTDLGHDVVLYALAEDGRGFPREPRCRCVLVPNHARRGDILDFVRGSIDAYVEGWDARTPRFDVHHAHDGISGNALATLAQRGRIPGFVRTVHHLDDFTDRELAALQDRSVARAAACLVVSEIWRDRVGDSYGVAATLVPNGVDAARFAPVPAAERARLRAVFGRGPLFVTIGGIEPRKNTLALLEAFARVQVSEPETCLVVAGGASVFSHAAYRHAFDARAAQLGLAGTGALVVAGVLSDDEIVDLLRAANAFVFPSLVEGFGLVVLEALSCGTPVVTSNIAPFTEYLAAGDAQMADPRDPASIAQAMLRAIQPLSAMRASVRGPAVARRFDWTASARAHVRAFAGANSESTEIAHA
jgi:glycosyltransferase-like protein